MSERIRSGGRVAVAALFIAGTVGLAGCGGWAPYPDPSGAAAEDVVLRPIVGDIGCDTVQMPYRSVTFTIDPTAEEDVTALTNLGAGLVTYWGPGFHGGTAADPVVYGPDGAVVARDGDVLAIPEGAWPSLGGYFVCPSPNALYIFNEPAPE